MPKAKHDSDDHVQQHLQIKPPNFQTARIKIVGNAPYVQHKFSQKTATQMAEKMKAGSVAKKGKTREARDFEQDFRNAQYRSREGWNGIPASCFRNACISACRTVGFKMTHAKLGLFVEADGFDPDEGTPLVRIHGEPRMHVQHVRNATGVVDLRSRPMWDEWHAILRLKWDADMFTLPDIVNLLSRVGVQVGIGEGRPDSKMSAGQGWGTFDVGTADVKELEDVRARGQVKGTGRAAKSAA